MLMLFMTYYTIGYDVNKNDFLELFINVYT